MVTSFSIIRFIPSQVIPRNVTHHLLYVTFPFYKGVFLHIMFARISVFNYFCITIANPNVIMKTLLSILFLFFATYGYSQSEKLFTVDRELSNSNINQIYQAKDGVI